MVESDLNSLSLNDIEGLYSGEYVLIQQTAEHIVTRQPSHGFVLYHGNWGGLYPARKAVADDPELSKLCTDLGRPWVQIEPAAGKEPAIRRLIWWRY